MKASLKNSNGFVRFLLRHGEKIGIVVLLAAAGMLFYSSLGRERLSNDQLPSAIETSANSARERVENMSWENFPPEEVVPPASEFPVAAFSKPLPEGAFPPLPRYDGPITAPMELRQDPVLLAVRDLEVDTGSGIWASGDADELRARRLQALEEQRREAAEAEEERRRMAEEEENRRGRGRGRGRDEDRYGEERGAFGGSFGMDGQLTPSGAVVIRPRGGAVTEDFMVIRARSWVVVKAVVPLKEQIELFKDALENARGYNQSDFPEYRGYQVQRAEVTPEGVGDWQLLGNFYDKTLIEEISQWPVQTPEVVNSKFVHPLLTFPLPPMVLRMWDEEVTHSSMPLPTPEDLMFPDEMPEDDPAAMDDETNAEEPDDPFARRRPRRQPGAMPYGGETDGYRGRGGEFGGRAPGAYGGGRGGYGGGFDGEMGGYGGGEFGGYGRGAMMGMGGGYGMSSQGDIELPTYQWDGKTKKLLFRFFDATVQPGARYKYRVRLVLSDPNANTPAKYLDPTVSARREEEGNRTTRFTEWSEPSSTAVVPPPGLIYLASAQPASSSNYSSEPEAEFVVKTLNATYAAEAAIMEEFTRGSVINLHEYAKVIWSNAYRPEDDEKEPEFDFRTGVTLLDLTGGDKLDGLRDLTAPARALMMDSGGRLSIKEELDDFETVREYNAIVEAMEEARRQDSERDRGGGRRRGEF